MRTAVRTVPSHATVGSTGHAGAVCARDTRRHCRRGRAAPAASASTSGRDADKAEACAAAGFAWLDEAAPAREDSSTEQLLPGCAAYLRLYQVGELLDAGEHDVALCRVEAFADPNGPAPDAALSSAALRAAGLITDKGRAVEPVT